MDFNSSSYPFCERKRSTDPLWDLPSDMKYLLLLITFLIACAQPVVRQRELGAIHTKATRKCKSEPTECHKMMMCGDATRKASVQPSNGYLTGSSLLGVGNLILPYELGTAIRDGA